MVLFAITTLIEAFSLIFAMTTLIRVVLFVYLSH